MTITITMVVDVNDTAPDGRPNEAWDVESNIRDALTEWTGNNVEFFAVDVIECKQNNLEAQL